MKMNDDFLWVVGAALLAGLMLAGLVQIVRNWRKRRAERIAATPAIEPVAVDLTENLTAEQPATEAVEAAAELASAQQAQEPPPVDEVPQSLEGEATLAAEKKAAEKEAAEAAARLAAEQEAAEAARLAAEKEAAEKEAAEAAARLAAEQEAAEAARLAAEKEAAEKEAAEAAARLAAEQEAAEAARLAAEKEAAEKEAAEAAARIAAERRATDRRATDRRATDAQAHAAAEQQAAEVAARLAAEQAAAEQLARSAAVPPVTKVIKSPEQTVVMIADDSKVVRIKTGRLLTKHLYQVAVAEDGDDAAKQIDASAPDVLITDVEMPGLDGFELTRHVRDNPRTAHVPIIMISSNGSRIGEEASQAGVDVVLDKPYDEDALIAHIQRLMA
jgi:CheY-like chemotaxis protein